MTEGGFRVIRPQDRSADTASGAMHREAAISGGLVGAQKLWCGYVELPPGSISSVHHHGESESAIYMLSGNARFCAGESLEGVFDAQAGDFVWVPPHIHHVEMNMSDKEPVLMVVVRSTQEALVFNIEAPAGWEPPRG